MAEASGEERQPVPLSEPIPEGRTEESVELDQETERERASMAPGPPAPPTEPEDPNCMDITPECAGWSEEGECEANAEYMQEACARSCKFCKPAVL